MLSAQWSKTSCIGKRRKIEERKKERKEKEKRRKEKRIKRKKKKERGKRLGEAIRNEKKTLGSIFLFCIL